MNITIERIPVNDLKFCLRVKKEELEDLHLPQSTQSGIYLEDMIKLLSKMICYLIRRSVIYIFIQQNCPSISYSKDTKQSLLTSASKPCLGTTNRYKYIFLRKKRKFDGLEGKKYLKHDYKER